MGKRQINKVVKPAIKALEEFNKKAEKMEISRAEVEDRLMVEAKASVAIEHPSGRLYDIS